MLEFDWKWRPNSAKFRPSYYTHPPEYGKATHNFRSPYWMVEYNLPPRDETFRREIATFLAETEGKYVVNFYDPRVPFPAFYSKLMKNGSSESIIPQIIVRAVTKATSSIVVSGQVGDRITKDDPIAFTRNGQRHYYRSKDDLTLNGNNQTLRVYLRPRETLTGLVEVAERVRPTNRFIIDINQIDDLTSADGFTTYTITGVEFYGVIT